MSSEATKSVQVGIRLPVELARELRESAEKNDRTLSQTVRLASRLYLEGQGQEASGK
jgi:hypothetical protein